MNEKSKISALKITTTILIAEVVKTFVLLAFFYGFFNLLHLDDVLYKTLTAFITWVVMSNVMSNSVEVAKRLDAEGRYKRD